MTKEKGCKFTTDYTLYLLLSKQKKALHNGKAAREVTNKQRAMTMIDSAYATSFDFWLKS
jgi:hypothetical protein